MDRTEVTIWILTKLKEKASSEQTDKTSES
nr:MAG TPA: hypothetical protein [Bacteriophage sp.]